MPFSLQQVFCRCHTCSFSSNSTAAWRHFILCHWEGCHCQLWDPLGLYRLGLFWKHYQPSFVVGMVTNLFSISFLRFLGGCCCQFRVLRSIYGLLYYLYDGFWGRFLSRYVLDLTELSVGFVNLSTIKGNFFCFRVLSMCIDRHQAFVSVPVIKVFSGPRLAQIFSP